MLYYIYRNEERTKTMKTTTLTTEQRKEIERLFKNYQESESKVIGDNVIYKSSPKQQKAASTRAYGKLVRYIESVTTQPAHQIIFKLINP